MYRAFIFAVAALSLAACGIDRSMRTDFEPGPNGTFRMVARLQGPSFDEQERLGWLDQYIRDNHVCPAGYKVTDRKQVLEDHHWTGDVFTIYYYGKCIG